MNDRTRKLLAALGYSLWFWMLFLVLTLLTFPWSRVRDNVTVAAAKSDMALTMDSLGPAWVGARARNLSVGAVSKGAATAPWVTFERVKARTGLFSVLRASRALSGAAAEEGKASAELVELIVTALGSASLDGDLYGGELVMDLGQAGDEAAQFDMNLRDINLATFEVANPSFSMNPRGTLRGKSDVTWNWKDVKKAGGSIELAIDDLIISGLKAGGFGLPEMAFTRSEAHLKIARGKAEFHDTVFEADEVQAVVEGNITLQESLMRSRLAIKLRFKLRDDLDGLAKVAFGSNPRHKDEDGWYHYQLNGTLARYRFREAAAAAGSAKRATSSRASTRTPRRMEPEDDDEEDDKVTRRSNPPSDQPIARKKLHEMEDPAEIEAERERLREEREKRREERKARREELLAKRRERQERLQEEREEGGGQQVQFDDNSFVRSNGAQDSEDDEEEGEDEVEEEVEEELEEPVDEPEEFIEELPEGNFDENDEGGDGGDGGDGEYIEE